MIVIAVQNIFCLKIIFYFLKIIFDISTSKRSQKIIIFNKKKTFKFEGIQFTPHFQ